MAIVNQYGNPGILMDVAYAIGEGKGAEDRRRFERVQGANERAQFADIQQGRDRLNLGRQELQARVADQKADRVDRAAQAQAQREFQLEMQGRQQDASVANREDTQAFETARYEEGSPYDLYQQREQQRRADTELQIRNPTAYDKKKRYELIEGIKRVQSEGRNQGWRPAEIQAKTAALQQELAAMGPEPKELTTEDQVKQSTYWDGGEWNKGTPWVMDPKTGTPRVPQGWTPPDAEQKASMGQLKPEQVDKLYDSAKLDLEDQKDVEFQRLEKRRKAAEGVLLKAKREAGWTWSKEERSVIDQAQQDFDNAVAAIEEFDTTIPQEAVEAEFQRRVGRIQQTSNPGVTRRPGMTPPFVQQGQGAQQQPDISFSVPSIDPNGKNPDAYQSPDNGLVWLRGRESEGPALLPGKRGTPPVEPRAVYETYTQMAQQFLQQDDKEAVQAALAIRNLILMRGNIGNMRPEEVQAYRKMAQIISSRKAANASQP